MQNSSRILAASVLLLSACATAPTVQVLEVCPRVPELERASPDVLEPDYINLIAQFLSGSLPPLPNSKLGLKPATPLTTPLQPN